MITRLLLALLWSLVFTVYVVLVYIALFLIFLFWNHRIFSDGYYMNFVDIFDVYVSIWEKSWSRL